MNKKFVYQVGNNKKVILWCTANQISRCVGYILHEEWDMKELCVRWVPRLLTADQKRTCMKISEQCLEHFNKNKTDFVCRFITMDEAWIYHCTQESKQQSKQWREAGCSAKKKTRSVPSAGKVMASVFWDVEGILFIAYLEKGKTITREYYSNLLTRLDKKKFVRKDPVCKWKKSSFIRTPHLPTKVFWQWEN